MLPRGVEEYLERRRAAALRAGASGQPCPRSSRRILPGRRRGRGRREEREARKTMARVEKQLARLHAEEELLHAQLVEHASDFERLAQLDARLREVTAEREALEEEWLVAVRARASERPVSRHGVLATATASRRIRPVS